jgi:hypothetical protein
MASSGHPSHSSHPHRCGLPAALRIDRARGPSRVDGLQRARCRERAESFIPVVLGCLLPTRLTSHLQPARGDALADAATDGDPPTPHTQRTRPMHPTELHCMLTRQPRTALVHPIHTPRLRPWTRLHRSITQAGHSPGIHRCKSAVHQPFACPSPPAGGSNVRVSGFQRGPAAQLTHRTP